MEGKEQLPTVVFDCGYKQTIKSCRGDEKREKVEGRSLRLIAGGFGADFELRYQEWKTIRKADRKAFSHPKR